MKRFIGLTMLLLSFCALVSAQKMTEPKLLGSLIAGDDPSEFLLHTVMEASQYHLKDNPDGKLVLRICGTGDFSTAFVKSAFNPLSAANYNDFTQRILVPFEKIFIAKSSKCVKERSFVFTQHWFVPNEISIEYDEIFRYADISNRSFYVDDFDVYRNKYLKTREIEAEFAKKLDEFVRELKTHPNAQGFIVHNSKNKTMKTNIEKIRTRLVSEKISPKRVKTVIRIRMNHSRSEKLIPVKDEKKYFPELEILTIKK